MKRDVLEGDGSGKAGGIVEEREKKRKRKEKEKEREKKRKRNMSVCMLLTLPPSLRRASRTPSLPSSSFAQLPDGKVEVPGEQGRSGEEVPPAREEQGWERRWR